MSLQRPKRTKRPRSGIRDEAQWRCPTYRQWMRGFPCDIAGKNGHVCVGKTAGAHARTGTDGGLSVKPSDFWLMPLCDDGFGGGAHGEQGRIGEAAFEKKYGIVMQDRCRVYWGMNSTQRLRYEAEHGRASPHDLSIQRNGFGSAQAEAPARCFPKEPQKVSP